VDASTLAHELMKIVLGPRTAAPKN
jgi:hypothetical protein